MPAVGHLVHAPDPATAERVHRKAHGEIPNAIIPVDLAAVEAFLGRIGDPRAAPGAAAPAVDSGLRAVMFTDIVGSTEMTGRLGDSAALELVRAHDALVRRGLEAYGGREIKHTGDGIMASFDNVANSVRAAADIQRRFAAYNVSGRNPRRPLYVGSSRPFRARSGQSPTAMQKGQIDPLLPFKISNMNGR